MKYEMHNFNLKGTPQYKCIFLLKKHSKFHTSYFILKDKTIRI
jgi:hypothetical protein